jgi:hypothetical protein
MGEYVTAKRRNRFDERSLHVGSVGPAAFASNAR